MIARGVTPCGLGARDTLRLEVCYPLHGNDIGPQWDAISSGLGWACALDTDFTGAERLREIKEHGPEQKLVPFVMTEKAIPRQGMPIEGGGLVTSGSQSPMLEDRDRTRLRARGTVERAEPSSSSTCAVARARRKSSRSPSTSKE